MEDSWQAVPDLLMVPGPWAREVAGRDQLPIVPPPLQQQGEGDPAPVADAGAPAAGEAAAPQPSKADEPTQQQAAAPAAPQEAQPSCSSSEELLPTSAHFFAVYDGHGGADVAKHCAKNLHELLKKAVQSSNSAAAGKSRSTDGSTPNGAADPASQPAPTGAIGSMEAALKHAFVQVDTDLAAERTAHEVGSTAVVALLGTTHLWVGNCGDSRALLCRDNEAVALSLDHKAMRSDEVTRVEQAGGYVWWDRVMGELAVSRAIGDHCLRPFVIAEPEVTYVVRKPDDVLLLLASDGLWDVFTNEEARVLALEKFRGELTKNASSKLAVKKAASSLAKAALAKGSRDNITVIVVDVRLSAAVAPPVRAQAASASIGATDGENSDDADT